MSNLTTSMVHVAINKAIRKEYCTSKCSRTVYMEPNAEFQLELFNPYSFKVAAEIFLNDRRINRRFVLMPGQRVWLDRFLDENRKFKFTTYEIEEGNYAAENAAADNGKIKVVFYRESQNISYTIYNSDFNIRSAEPIISTPEIWCNISSIQDVATNYCCDTVPSVELYSAQTNAATSISSTSCSIADHFNSGSTSCSLGSCSADYLNTADTAATASTTNTASLKETGYIDKGGISDQVLTECKDDFSTFSFSHEELLILPESQKPYTSNDLVKQYCPSCGHKVNAKFAYCPYCGNRL